MYQHALPLVRRQISCFLKIDGPFLENPGNTLSIFGGDRLLIVEKSTLAVDVDLFH